MKVRYLLFGGLIVATGIMAYISYNFYHSSTLRSQAIQQMFLSVNTKEKQLEDNTIRQISLEGLPFRDTLFQDETGKTVRLDTFLSSPKLCVYVGPEYCSKCVAQHIETVKKYVDSIGTENIVFLFQGVGHRDLKDFRLSNGFKSLALSVRQMKTFKMEEPFPFFFMLDKNGTINDVFVPLGHSPDFNGRYFETLKQKYFQ